MHPSFLSYLARQWRPLSSSPSSLFLYSSGRSMYKKSLSLCRIGCSRALSSTTSDVQTRIRSRNSSNSSNSSDSNCSNSNSSTNFDRNKKAFYHSASEAASVAATDGKNRIDGTHLVGKPKRKNSIVALDDYLFGKDAMEFKDLHFNLHEQLVEALNSSGYTKALAIQAKSIPAVLNKVIGDGGVYDSNTAVVIGAETGGGKTLAYAVPVIEKLLRGSAQVARKDCHPSVAVFVPNKELAMQVFEVFAGLTAKLRGVYRPIRVGIINNASSAWPFSVPSDSPDIVICVPAVFAKLVKGPKILEPGVFNSLNTIVYDEADLLFDGSYNRDLDVIFDTLKLVRRAKIARGELKVHEPSPLQYILSAATIPYTVHGGKSTHFAIKKRFPNAIEVTNNYMHMHHPRIVQKYVSVGDSQVLSDRRIRHLIRSIRDCTPSSWVNADSESKLKLIEVADNSSSSSSSDNDNVNKSLVDASIYMKNNVNGSKSSNAPATNEQAIVSTMIFVNTAQAAVDLSRRLRDDFNVGCVEYHKEIKDVKARSKNLRLFQEGREMIMVCTDQAARGLDIPIVKHVIQAEFALNVVSHMHRVGRASRAGRLGFATNFYDSTSKDLVDAIVGSSQGLQEPKQQQQGGGDEHRISLPDTVSDGITTSFSRRRGFRHRINRRLERNDASTAKQQQQLLIATIDSVE